MARKKLRVSRRMLFIWLMLVGFIFLFAPQKMTNNFQSTFAHIFQWPLSIGRDVSLSARAQQLPTDIVPRSQYNKLQNHLANVTEWLNQERRKNKKLSGLKARGILEGADVIIADIITASAGGSRTELVIDHGEDDGIKKGQYVLAENSIIGIVSAVFPRTTRVKLLTDSTSKIAVKIGGFNVSRLMQGDGNESAKIQLLPYNKYKIKVGNVVFACKEPGFLNSATIAGSVVQCKRDDENPSLWDITVKPVCDIKKLADVVVIIINPKN